jgi:Tol biopolymer transport system component
LNNRDIWIVDAARKTTDRITYDQAAEISPIWSPNGTRLLFGSNRTGRNNIYHRAASSAGGDKLIIDDRTTKYPIDWSSDGRLALALRQSGAPTGNDLWVLSIADRKLTAFMGTSFSETNGRFSPDNKWVAYQSNRSGRGEVYVASFPDPVMDVTISIEGGGRPRWRDDGKELFYVSLNKLMKVPIAVINNRLQPGVPVRVLEADFRLDGRYPYDLSGDGERFLVNEYTEQGQSYPMTVLTNWTTTLRK